MVRPGAEGDDAYRTEVRFLQYNGERRALEQHVASVPMQMTTSSATLQRMRLM
jgi:hypothetical protein